MGVKVKNNAFGTISAGISASDTTVVLDTGQGARFPTLGSGDFFFGTLVDTSNNIEVVKVTARSTDSMTVTRAQDNTTARAFAIGDRFELRPTAALFDEKANISDVVTTTGGATIEGVFAVENTAGNNDSTIITQSNSEAGFGILPWSGGSVFLSTNVKYENGQWVYFGETSTGRNPNLLRLDSSGLSYYNASYGSLSNNVVGSWDNASDVELFDQYGMPARGVLQTVASTYTAGFSTTTMRAYQSTGHTLAITTKSDSSKIYIMMWGQGYQASGGGINFGIERKIGSGSYSDIIGVDGASGDTWMGANNGISTNSVTICRSVLDAPAQNKGVTLTYQATVGQWQNSGGQTAFYNYPSYSGTCTLVAMEIQT